MNRLDEYFEELDSLELLRTEARPVAEMTSNQRAVAGIVAILLSVDDPQDVLRIARYYLKIAKGILPSSPQEKCCHCNDGTADSPVTKKNNMMSLHIEIKGLYCPTRTGYETKLAEQLRCAASRLQIDEADIKVVFSASRSQSSEDYDQSQPVDVQDSSAFLDSQTPHPSRG